MAPIRRYLRISKYSVLECRIYLENPADSRWLLDTRDPVLPRIFTAIRPLVLPKLREENERIFAKKKSKPVKDVIAEDDFEVAIFLRESRTRHSLLTRHKTFEGTKDVPTDGAQLGETTSTGPEADRTGTAGTAGAGIVVEDSEDEMDLGDVPRATSNEDDSQDNDRTPKRRKGKEPLSRPFDPEPDEDKKLGFRTKYESFNIHGWVLCLLVTRKGDKGKGRLHVASSDPPRQALMEEWISTQAQGDVDED